MIHHLFPLLEFLVFSLFFFFFFLGGLLRILDEYIQQLTKSNTFGVEDTSLVTARISFFFLFLLFFLGGLLRRLDEYTAAHQI